MFRFNSASKQQASIVISDDRINIAAIAKYSSVMELTELSEWRREPNQELSSQIKDIATRSGLLDANWNLVLTSSQYQLLQVDVPEIPEEEINNTLKLKASDLLQYPISEAALSVFHLPSEAYRGRLKMAYIVAAKKNLITNFQDEFGYLGLRLESVDIADMAIRNLGMLVTQKESFAVLRLGNDSSYINCCFQGHMCLNRRVDVGLNQLIIPSTPDQGLTVDNLQIHLDSMALEIQRSLDYFESQLGLGSIPEIFVIAPDEVDESVMKRIDHSFQSRVMRLSPNEHLKVNQNYQNDIFTSNCIALGGALRNIGVHS